MCNPRPSTWIDQQSSSGSRTGALCRLLLGLHPDRFVVISQGFNLERFAVYHKSSSSGAFVVFSQVLIRIASSSYPKASSGALRCLFPSLLSDLEAFSPDHQPRSLGYFLTGLPSDRSDVLPRVFCPASSGFRFGASSSGSRPGTLRRLLPGLHPDRQGVFSRAINLDRLVIFSHASHRIV